MATVDTRKIKCEYTPELGKSKQLLYRRAYRRIQRVQKIGAHIEAVALIETLMSDRLESAISTLTGDRVTVSSLGKLLYELKRHHEIPEALLSELLAWNKSRAFVIHQMVKITDSTSISWEDRIKFARSASKEGLLLLNELRKVTDKIIRNHKSKSG